MRVVAPASSPRWLGAVRCRPRVRCRCSLCEAPGRPVPKDPGPRLRQPLDRTLVALIVWGLLGSPRFWLPRFWLDAGISIRWRGGANLSGPPVSGGLDTLGAVQRRGTRPRGTRPPRDISRDERSSIGGETGFSPIQYQAGCGSCLDNELSAPSLPDPETPAGRRLGFRRSYQCETCGGEGVVPARRLDSYLLPQRGLAMRGLRV